MTSIPTLGLPVFTLEAEWITPKNQLERLVTPMAEALVQSNKEFETIPEAVIPAVVRGAVRSILNDLLKLESNDEIPSLADLASERLFESFVGLHQPPPSLTDWYKARELLGTLPEKLPPLPESICSILSEQCPIFGYYPRKGGSFCTVADTHILQLVCPEDGSLKHLVETAESYGSKICPADNPLRFQFPLHASMEEYDNAPFNSYWVLMVKDILPKSRGLTYEEHTKKVIDLVKDTSVNYEIPRLRSLVTVFLLHAVATKELLPVGAVNGEQKSSNTYARVQKPTQDSPASEEQLRDYLEGEDVVAGGYKPSGLSVSKTYPGFPNIGLIVQRTFKRATHA